jgi:hypothetical protein
MIQQTAFLLAITLSVFFVDDPVDSIKKKITKAEEVHRLELAKAQADVIKWLDGREATARKKGDKTTVNIVKQQREKLESEGTIPKPIPVNMSRKVDTARDLLDASYASIMKEALMANLDDLADELEDKRVELSKDKPCFKLVSHMAKNLVENGSFEFPEVPKGTGHTRLNGNGWDTINHDVVKFDGAVPVHGVQMLQLGGEITQQVKGFIPGERYVVTAYVGTYASLNHPNNVSTVSVSIAGEKAEATATATNKGSKNPYVMTGAGSNKWEQISFVFKALGETHELKLKVESSTNAGLATIDQVSVLPFLNK